MIIPLVYLKRSQVESLGFDDRNFPRVSVQKGEFQEVIREIKTVIW